MRNKYGRRSNVGSNRDDAKSKGLLLYISDRECPKDKNHKVRYVSCNRCYECFCSIMAQNNRKKVNPDLEKQLKIRRTLEEKQDLAIDDDYDFEGLD